MKSEKLGEAIASILFIAVMLLFWTLAYIAWPGYY